MKKLYMFFSILILSVLLVACGDVKDDNNQNETKDTFLFVLEGLENNKLVEETIDYDGESVFNSLNSKLELEYDEYSFGVLITSINGYKPGEIGEVYGYYFALYVNNELSKVGISDVLYRKNLTITIKIEKYELNPEVLSFNFMLVNIKGETLINQAIIYDGLSVFSSLDASLDLDYTEYPFGVMINGINNHYPFEYGITDNYHYLVYVNDEESMVGISDLHYSDNLAIKFVETTTLNEVDQEVDNIIYNMKNVLSDTNLDYNLLASLQHANKYQYNFYDLSNYDYTMNLSDIGNAFKSVVADGLLNKLTTEEINSLLDFEATNQYDIVNYLNLLNALNIDTFELRTNLATDLISKNNYIDADSAAGIIAATSNLDLESVNSYRSEMITYLKTKVTKDGMDGWGGANASSTAQTILALLALGESVVFEELNLVEALLTFYSETGFKNNLEGQVDTFFATPQSYASLIIYKIVRDQLAYSPDQSLNIFNLGNEN